MSDLIIPDTGSHLSALYERVAELERRVMAFDTPDAEEGCCTVLCCNDQPGDALGAGEFFDYCTVTLEETAGVATRLAINGDAVVRADAAGQIIFDVAAVVSGQAYFERPIWDMTMASGGRTSLHVTNTIDTNDASPTVSIRVRNLNTVAITVIAVNLQVLVYGVRDGSVACGESAGTS